MSIVIDGWNLIRNEKSDIEDIDIESLESAMALISYLEQFQASHSDPIVLVFDSSREFLNMKYHNTPLLTIVAAKDADVYIKRYIDKAPERQRRNIRVVSSDNDLFYYAKHSSATPVKCEEFWAKLRGERYVSR